MDFLDLNCSPESSLDQENLNPNKNDIIEMETDKEVSEVHSRMAPLTSRRKKRKQECLNSSPKNEDDSTKEKKSEVLILFYFMLI